MATLTATKWGHVAKTGAFNHSDARNATTGTSVTSNPGIVSSDSVIGYSRASGRGRSLNYSIRRQFLYFDTSGITGTVSNLTVNIKGYSAGDADITVCLSDAFGGDGSTNLTTADFNNVTFGTTYSSETTTWNTSANNAIILNSAAETAVQNNNAFIIALVQYDNDHQNVNLTSNQTLNNGVNYNPTPYLDYTETIAATGPANVTSLSSIAKANITNINTITLANISSINGVS